MSEPPEPEGIFLSVLNEDPRGWEVRVATTLVRFHSRLERRMAEVLGTHGLSSPQFDVLATLWHGEGITQQELAERLLVTKGNVVGILNRISAAGWVERRPDPEDRRANRLFLTAEGRNLVEKALPCQMALGKRIFGTLTEAELRQMDSMLERLEKACRSHS